MTLIDHQNWTSSPRLRVEVILLLLMYIGHAKDNYIRTEQFSSVGLFQIQEPNTKLFGIQ